MEKLELLLKLGVCRGVGMFLGGWLARRFGYVLRLDDLPGADRDQPGNP